MQTDVCWLLGNVCPQPPEPCSRRCRVPTLCAGLGQIRADIIDVASGVYSTEGEAYRNTPTINLPVKHR